MHKKIKIHIGLELIQLATLKQLTSLVRYFKLNNRTLKKQTLLVCFNINLEMVGDIGFEPMTLCL
jgi:hypothetical protein